MTPLPLVQLVDGGGRPADFVANGDHRTYADLVTPTGLDFVAAYAEGIGAGKDVLVPSEPDGTLAAPSSVIDDARDAGLFVPGWTFRRENRYLSAGHRRGVNPNGAGDMVAEVRAFLAAGMDGFFTDNPDLGAQARSDRGAADRGAIDRGAVTGAPSPRRRRRGGGRVHLPMPPPAAAAAEAQGSGQHPRQS